VPAGGLGFTACRESLAALAYHRTVTPPKRSHIIDKDLALAALAGVSDRSLDGYSLAAVGADPSGRVAAFLGTLGGRRPVVFHPFSSRRTKISP